jgi:hypothetical protein
MSTDVSDHDDWDYLKSLGLSFVLVGGILAALGIVSSFFLALQAGQDPVSTVLLLQSDVGIRALWGRSSLYDLGAGDLSLIAAFVGMFGLITLALPLIFYVATRDGVFKFLLLIWGMVTGLSITLIWFQWSAQGKVDIFNPSGLKIFYLYFAFLVAEAVKLAIEHKGLRTLPYNYLIDGLFGTASVLIVQAGYDLAMESLLLGPFFLIAVALSILIGEWVLARPASILFVSMGKSYSSKVLDRQLRSVDGSRSGLRVFTRHLRREIRKARSMSYERRVSWTEDRIEKLFRTLLPLLPKDIRSRRLGRWLVIGFCAISLLFLLIGTALALWLF